MYAVITSRRFCVYLRAGIHSRTFRLPACVDRKFLNLTPFNGWYWSNHINGTSVLVHMLLQLMDSDTLLGSCQCAELFGFLLSVWA